MKKLVKNPYKLNLSHYSTHWIIVRNVGNNKTVLDVGCKEGYLDSTTDKSNIFYGLDCSVGSIEKLR
jgi:hypothetical protein